MLESAAMKLGFSRRAALALVSLGCVVAVLPAETGCSSSLSQPFYALKGQPITIHRLQNFEPPAAAAGAPGLPGAAALPPQIQQWLGGAAAMLPPGLIPPGLLPGTTPGAVATDAPRFYGFRILGTVSVSDSKLRDEINELFGKESNFQAPKQSCMYAEFGIQIGQPPVAGAATSGGTPADILVSLSCDQVELKTYAWPYGTKTGLGPDTSKKIINIVQRAFGG